MKEVKYIPGDLIKSDRIPNSIWKIEEVLQDKYWGALYRCVDARNDIYCTNLYKHRIVPIPLTIEILEKNGWKLLKHHERNSYDDVSWSSYHKPAETNISLVFYPEEEAFFLFLYAQEISETPIRYIHQFQHILWALYKNVNFKI